ncbi:MAG: hypothetical protein KDD44_01940 [Bdellovibrionales bacterium]|nr:hypothetical protein [Bdellovibrionales bacterium]
MPLTINSSSLSIGAYSAPAGRSSALDRGSQRENRKEAPALAAASPQVSSSERAAARKERQVLSNLSSAASIASVAKQGASAIKSLIERSQSLTEKLANTVSESEKDELSQEIFLISRSINTVVRDAEVNGINVLNADTASFTFDTDGGDASSSSEVTVTIPNAPISANKLKINTTPAEVIADVEGYQDKLDEASLTVSAAVITYGEAERSVTSAAERLGLQASAAATQSAADSQAGSPEALAQQIASALKEGGVISTNQLDPLAVEDLLANEVPSASAES